ncbi:diguanylate cyclase [bacterium]|nr:diguanylate cyclase [bacterium]
MKSQYVILTVDDDANILKLLQDFLGSKGYLVHSAPTGAEAFQRLASHDYDLVLVDLKLPDASGLEIVKWIKQNRPDTISVILSGYATIETTLDAISHGAFDFLVKPVELPKLLIVVENGIERRNIILQNKKLISDLQIAKRNLEARVRQRTEQLKKSEQKFRLLYDNAPDVYYTVDTRGEIIDCNKMACEFFGYNKRELKAKHMLDIYTSENFELVARMVPTPDGKGGKVRHQEVQVKRADGGVAEVEINSNLMVDDGGDVIGALTIQRDITTRKKAQERLRESEERYRTIFRIAEVALWEMDYAELRTAVEKQRDKGVRDWVEFLDKNPEFVVQATHMVRIIDVNDASLKLYGADNKSELVGSVENIMLPETDDTIRQFILALAEDRNSLHTESIHRTLRGDRIHVLVNVAIPPMDARYRNILISIVDITERQKAEEEKDRLLSKLHELNKQLETLSVTDGLTELYNHRFFMESLTLEFSRARRANQNLAMLMADIDNFKRVNDTYGHQFGDEVLIHIARLLRGSRRGSDIVARYGGEEFVLLLPDTNLEQARALGDKLRRKIENSSVLFSGNKIKVTISVGAAALDNENVKNHRELLILADKGLYLAKRTGKNRLCVFGEDSGKPDEPYPSPA